MTTSGRVIWHLGGGDMGSATQWPPQKHQHQHSDKKTTAQPRTPSISLVAPTNLTLHRQNVYPSLANILCNLLDALQKMNGY